MKIKVFYENGSQEVIDSVKDLRIVGNDRISRDGRFIRDVAVWFDDNDKCVLKGVLKVEES